MNDLFSLQGRVALVTGGSRGIGKMIAKGFIAQGARVYISSRKADVCEATAKELSQGGGKCIALPVDVSTNEGIAALVAAYGRHESKLDILVNNAGAAWLAEFDAFPEKGWDKVVDLNLKAPFFLTQALHGALQSAARPERPCEGDQHRVDRRRVGESAGDVLVRREQVGADSPDEAHGAATGAGEHRRVGDRAGRVRVGHEHARARSCRRGREAHSGEAHRHRRGHGRRRDLPRVARGRLRRGLDADRRRRRHSREGSRQSPTYGIYASCCTL